MQEYKKTLGMSLGLITTLALVIAIFSPICYFAYIWWQNQLPPRIPSPPQTSSDGVAAATRIAEWTATPGVEGIGQVATLVPWTDVYQLGDVPKLKIALANLYATKGVDLRVSTINEFGAIYVYCYQHYQPIRNPDTTKPLYKQVAWLYPKTRYCAGVITITSLYGGVPQKDLMNLTVEPVNNQSVKNEETRQIIHTQSAKVTITARMGLLNESGLPGVSIKDTFDDPEETLRAFFEYSRQFMAGDENYWREKKDKGDTLGLWGSQWDVIAPLDAKTGQRSTLHLDLLKKETEKHFNSPSPDPNKPWPYDNLLLVAKEEAKKQGFTDVTELKVNIIFPYEEGVYYYLETIGTDNQKPVIDAESITMFKDNLYPYLIKDVEIPADWTSKVQELEKQALIEAVKP